MPIRKAWFDDRMVIVGWRLTLSGAITLFAAYVSSVLFQFFYAGQGNNFLSAVFMIVSNTFWIAMTMVLCGIPLYCVGRLIEGGPYTLVGFEKATPSELIVKDPDETHTVWIGRTYASAYEAEAAAALYRKRLGRTQ